MQFEWVVVPPCSHAVHQASHALVDDSPVKQKIYLANVYQTLRFLFSTHRQVSSEISNNSQDRVVMPRISGLSNKVNCIFPINIFCFKFATSSEVRMVYQFIAV